ncbi:hypothetical protein TWF569_009126 [Orbilia oligospora]|uniref:Uncharacterized protein n=1 Tax=Orbilia oligospora TaxID=2813651 RepID=A0A7C8JPL6_ORBOL|nr:hypothetical protein TWF103_010446 [Orbilia oligospora]KAF3097727.1 hypothetical protein TWF102_006245 [Orbilia oligospora]KAF3102182.1 hypothetical protein TWF706_005337 [Orbilia oligospora]KAF3122325.1 hypothetical protein TWF594_002852 [Orbilia oligospora]KAF3130058.1 hypothetical protein TWF703_008397 [Orbilia oligospora]
MNIFKSSNTDMANTEAKIVPEANSPHFKNAQALEEPSSPVSPTYDNVPRRTSGSAEPGFGEPGFKYDMFGTNRPEGIQEVPIEQRDRRMSKEWDASKVPPSRFQKRAGSIHATPPSRDGHIQRNDRTELFEKLSKGKKGERRKSQS